MIGLLLLACSQLLGRLRHGVEAAGGILLLHGGQVQIASELGKGTRVTLLTQAFEPAPNVCVGDCNSNGTVTVDELITSVNIALGTAAVSTCPSLACNGSGPITVDCLVKAVNAALIGCGN